MVLPLLLSRDFYESGHVDCDIMCMRFRETAFDSKWSCACVFVKSSPRFEVVDHLSAYLIENVGGGWGIEFSGLEPNSMGKV